MGFRKPLAILCLVAWATAVFAQHVEVDYDHAANFNRVKTYSWAEIHTADSIWDSRVKEAIVQQLTAKGWTQVATGGDVALTAVIKTSVRRQYDTVYQGFGGWRRFGGGMGDETTTVDNYEVGALIVSIFDSNSKQLIWRGIASGDTSDNPEKSTKKLEKVLEKMFKNFPVKAA